ncbi:multiple sugar transport system substrate-binding protein [Paenibacillus algorifonticola]|uniref:Multiple sugar transport system substrate-binding protein n=1 Tax=Paenibacillus algorifonticola TaxID=684063 RepID=A0A1I2HSC6_9BACL|nr:sugar ABC transporter substrate-binding protein [Paenibacillus algorifonticola]SFF31606.1 multiple sugar transport system substrate-binding protein [Paenibacillus algorifonticola]
MRIKKRVFVMLALAAALLGCTPQTSERPSGMGEEPITLRLAWWGSEFRNNATIQVIHRYEEQNPHINIEFEYSAFNEYWRKLAPYAAGNALPDIIQMDISYLSQYGTLDLLEDLEPYIQSGVIDASSISENNLSGGKLGDKLYGMNLGVNALFAYYDPEVFQASGMEPPAAAWTWDDFDQMGEQLKGKGFYLGTVLTPEQFFAYYLRQNGSSLFAKDGSRLGYEDDQLFIDYFSRMQRLAKDKLIFSPDIWTSDINESDRDPFYRGEALLGWGYSNQFISIVKSYGKQLAIVPLPGPDSKQGLFLKPGMFFSITKNSKNKEEAAKFISFFVNDLEANKLLKGERGVPISSKLKEQLKPFVEPELAQVFEYLDWVEKNSSPMDPPDPVGTAEVTTVLRELNDLLLFGKITPEEAAAEFRVKADGILASSKNGRVQ